VHTRLACDRAKVVDVAESLECRPAVHQAAQDDRLSRSPHGRECFDAWPFEHWHPRQRWFEKRSKFGVEVAQWPPWSAPIAVSIKMSLGLHCRPLAVCLIGKALCSAAHCTGRNLTSLLIHIPLAIQNVLETTIS